MRRPRPQCPNWPASMFWPTLNGRLPRSLTPSAACASHRIPSQHIAARLQTADRGVQRIRLRNQADWNVPRASCRRDQPHLCATMAYNPIKRECKGDPTTACQPAGPRVMLHPFQVGRFGGSLGALRDNGRSQKRGENDQPNRHPQTKRPTKSAVHLPTPSQRMACAKLRFGQGVREMPSRHGFDASRRPPRGVRRRHKEQVSD